MDKQYPKIQITDQDTKQELLVTWEQFNKKVAEPIVAAYFRKYQSWYRANAVDINDLKQEIMLLIWKYVHKNSTKTLKKRKSPQYLGSSLTQAIKWKLNWMRREGKRDFDKFLGFPKDNENLVYDGLTSMGTDNIAEVISTGPVDMVIMDQIKHLCTDQEYIILYKRFQEGATLLEIGDELGLTKERIRQIQHKALLKLKKNLTRVDFC